MGYIMDAYDGPVWIEAKRDGFVIGHRAEYHVHSEHPYAYDTLEIGYEDLPHLVRALADMVFEPQLKARIIELAPSVSATRDYIEHANIWTSISSIVEPKNYEFTDGYVG